MKMQRIFHQVSFILLLAFTFQSSQLIAQNKTLTEYDVSKIKNVSSVHISNDGNTAAYLLSVPADPIKENAYPESHLYLVDVNSGEEKAFITNRSISGVAFRPGYNSITYLAQMEGDDTRSIYEISLDGGESQKLYAFDTSISSYEWASDGNHLVFRASDPMSGGSESPLPYQPEIYEENLNYVSAYIQNVNVENHKPHKLPIEGHVVKTHWSPDRQKLALAVSPTPLVDDFYMAQKVVIVDYKTREVTSQIDHEGKLGNISWSPDSRHLALIAAANINDPIDGRLKIADIETGESRMLHEGFEGAFEQVEWEDNNTLRYLASKGVWSEFGRTDIDGDDMKAIFSEDGPNLGSFDMAENGAVVFTADSPAHPAEMYLMKRGDQKAERVTNSNPWLDEYKMAEQEVIRYDARDGLEIEGILIHPLNKEKGKRYPLITIVHGGPEAHYDNGWLTGYSQAGQVGAAEGFAVFYPNYRGSTGRGLDFAMSSQGDLAGAEFDDIVDGVDYLIEMGLVDRDRVGVTGGSYGGYATAWMSTYYSDRFAAGVMFVGISNNISKWGTSDIPEELYQVHARKRIWEDYQDYLERSPIYYVDRAKTPLLIMHGKEDTRVDPGQSYELYRHIKTRTETPVRLVLYPGEGHGNRRATARYDYSLRSMRWFNQFLKGEKQRPDAELSKDMMSIDQ